MLAEAMLGAAGVAALATTGESSPTPMTKVTTTATKTRLA